MKRIALLIIAMLTLGFAAQAQSTFTKGTTTANLGLGIGGTLFDKDFKWMGKALGMEGKDPSNAC